MKSSQSGPDRPGRDTGDGPDRRATGRDTADGAATELFARVEAALAGVDALPGETRECALDALAHLVALYGEGWRRALEVLDASGEPSMAQRLASDELVGHLLVVHGLRRDEEPTDDPPSRSARTPELEDGWVVAR